MTGSRPITGAPDSVDRIRVIRRSMRCLVYGAIGLVPFFGLGLAIQALRLRRSVSREVGETWREPSIYAYALGGLFGVGVANWWVGGVASAATCVVLLLLQSWHLARSYHPERAAVWNPGWPQVLWGVILARGGISLSLWLLVIGLSSLGAALGRA